MAEPLLNPGGRTNWGTNMQVTSARFNRIGDIALQSLTHALAWLFRDQVADLPPSGFPKAGDCKVTAAGLDVIVARGMGFYYDAAESDDYLPHYKPIVVSSATGATLAAHDATNPRIDIVCLAPARDTDDPTACFIKDPSLGTTSITSIDLRSRLTHTLQVVQGTPSATPAAPATPSGYLKIAEVLVPAVSGAVTVTDTRPILTFGHAFSADPSDEYVSSSGFVPGAANELVVSATSPASLNVRVAAGEAVCNGAQGTKRYRYEATTLAVSAAHATLTRVDLVVADDDGTLKVVAGTPAGSPVAPSPGTGQVPLAQYVVAALASSIANGDITDLRVREPFGTSQIRDLAITTSKIANGEVTAAKLSVAPIVVDLNLASGGGTAPAVIDLQLKDPDGGNVARIVRCLVEVLDADLSVLDTTPIVTETGAGTAVAGSGTPRMLFNTSPNGAAQITVAFGAYPAATTTYVRVTPFGAPAAGGLEDYVRGV